CRGPPTAPREPEPEPGNPGNAEPEPGTAATRNHNPGTAIVAPMSFVIGPVRAEPGASARGALDVPARAGDAGRHIPVTMLHRPSPGPVLALVAGVHGMEYVPVLALQRAAAAIDPATLHGTVVLVHAANVPSLLGRTIYYSPIDGKNLNRVFPGRADGTLSE